MLGAAVASSNIAVGSRCLFARAGVGAVLTQNRTDPRLGPMALGILAQGKTAQETIDAVVVGADRQRGWRQLAVIDLAGRTAHYSGANIVSMHATAARPGALAIGNLLKNAGVVQAEVDAFAEDIRPHLAERLVRALEAGFDAGGETSPVRSAALLVVHREIFPLIDLRVDDDDQPLAALRRLWQAYEPQIDDFVTRAIDPDFAGPAKRQ